MADRNLSTDNPDVAMIMAAMDLVRSIPPGILRNDTEIADAYKKMYAAVYEAVTTQRDSSTK